MTTLWIALAIVAGLLLAARIHWALLLSMYPEQLNTSEVHTLVTSDLWKLRLCRYRRGRSGGEPILFVHGLCANQHSFTIPADASLVDFLVAKGYDCWCIDLRGSRSSHPPFERKRTDAQLDDFLLHDLPAAVNYIREATRYGKIHWIGHSLGGMLLYAYVLEYGDDDIASGTTLGAPLGFKDVDTQWLEDAVFFVSRFPRFLGALVRAYIPLRGKLGLDIPLFPTNMRNLAEGITTAEVFTAIDDPPPRVLRTMARWASREEWRMKNETLDVAAGLATLRFPLLAFYGPEDPFVPLERARAFFAELPHDDKRMVVLSKENGCQYDYSHCELPFGKAAPREVFHPVHHWLREHPAVSPGRDFDGTEPAHLASMKPLGQSARAEILSGFSYAHLDAAEEQPEAVIEPPEALPPAPKQRAPKPPARRKVIARRKPAAKKPRP